MGAPSCALCSGRGCAVVQEEVRRLFGGAWGLCNVFPRNRIVSAPYSPFACLSVAEMINIILALAGRIAVIILFELPVTLLCIGMVTLLFISTCFLAGIAACIAATLVVADDVSARTVPSSARQRDSETKHTSDWWRLLEDARRRMDTREDKRQEDTRVAHGRSMAGSEIQFSSDSGTETDDAVGIISHRHGRLRRAERGISQLDFEEAVAKGTKTADRTGRDGKQRWRFVYKDVVCITDSTCRHEITSWRANS